MPLLWSSHDEITGSHFSVGIQRELQLRGGPFVARHFVAFVIYLFIYFLSCCNWTPRCMVWSVIMPLLLNNALLCFRLAYLQLCTPCQLCFCHCLVQSSLLLLFKCYDSFGDVLYTLIHICYFSSNLLLRYLFFISCVFANMHIETITPPFKCLICSEKECPIRCLHKIQFAQSNSQGLIL